MQTAAEQTAKDEGSSAAVAAPIAPVQAAPTAKLTPKQIEALKRAVSNGGTLEIGGLDGDPVRRDVLIRLFKMGFVKYDGIVGYHNWVGAWRITDAGRAAVNQEGK